MAFLDSRAVGGAPAVIALGLAWVVFVGPGCSSSDSSAGGVSVTDASADGFGVQDAATAADVSSSDVVPPSMCQPADVSTFQPPTYAPASGVHQGLCTQTQIDSIYQACLGSNATQAGCDMLIGTGASASDLACSACVFSQDSDTTHGPIIDRGSTVAINLPGCVELLDPNGLACAKSLQAADRCEVDACSANCPVSDAASLSLYDGCIDTAAEGGCKTFEMATGCADDEQDGGPAAACFAGTTFLEQYDAIVALFCGAPPTVGDAGAMPADAATE
jgi:hypothetical protein